MSRNLCLWVYVYATDPVCPHIQTSTSFSWLEPMLSMAMGLLGALLPDMSCSVRMCGEWRGGGADAEPPVGPMFVGGEGGIGPATAWTV